jgi:hypothetical protein
MSNGPVAGGVAENWAIWTYSAEDKNEIATVSSEVPARRVANHPDSSGAAGARLRKAA